jgi:hypothetical protein
MQNRRGRLTLNEVEIRCDASSKKGAFVGGLFNPFGAATWWNTDGMLFVFSLKKHVLIGPLTIKGIDVRGFASQRRRRELAGVNQPISFTRYLVIWMRLCWNGKDLDRLNTPVRLYPNGRAYSVGRR